MMHRFDTVLREGTGLAIVGAKVTVFIAGTPTLAQLFVDDEGLVQLANPTATDAFGSYSYYAADGNYDELTEYGTVSRLLENVTLMTSGEADPGLPDGDRGDIIKAGDALTVDPAVLSTFGRSMASASNSAIVRALLGLGTAASSNASDFQPMSVLLNALVALDLTGMAGKVLVVNDDEDGFDLVDAPTGGGGSVDTRHWINVGFVGTGASQNVPLFEPVDQDDCFVTIGGIQQTPGTDFTVAGSTLTGTFSNGLAGLIRYLGTIDGAVPANTVAPVTSGSSDVGSLLTLSNNGTWTNGPTSYVKRWTRDGVPIAGATGTTYTTINADVGANIRCEVAGVNSFGQGTYVASNAVGPVIIPSSGLSSTEATRISPDGAAPYVDLVMGVDIGDGFWLEIERTITDAGGLTPNWSVIQQSVAHMVTSAERAAGVIPNSALAADGYNNPPAGRYWQRYRWTDGGGNVGPWSVITDVLNASVAIWHSTNGVNKNSSLTITSPFLQITGINQGAPEGVRTTVAKVGKGHWEGQIKGMGGTSSQLRFGIVDAATALGPNLFPHVGLTVPGVSLIITPGSASATVYANGTNSSHAIPGGAPALDDYFITEFATDVDADTDEADTISFYIVRAAGGAASLIASKTLTAQIADGGVHGYASCSGAGDSILANYGALPFQMTPTVGYSGW